MKVLSFSNLYSHPDVALEKHLVGTASIATENFIDSPIQQVGNFQKNVLREVLLVSSLCHDLGKATSYFQQYLLAHKNNKEKLKGLEETKHSLLSAIASYYASYKQLDGAIQGNDDRAFLSFVSFLIVKRHHGDLSYVLDEAFISTKSRDVLVRQVESIDREKLRLLNIHLNQAGLAQEIDKPMLMGWVLSIKNDLTKLRRKLRGLGRSDNLNCYILINLLFSLLVDADKSEVVIGRNIGRNETVLTTSLIDNYKESLGFRQSKLNLIREKAYKEVVKQPIDPNKRVFSINLPTGLGKTFTSFAFAFKLRNTIKHKKGFCPRIIYALPFLSVIDQNADIIENILEFNGIELDTNLFLKHHHLSEIYYKKDEDEFETAKAKILIEGWNAELIVTTFVQLFHTLVSNRNRNLRKFHRLSGSIIILDEIQSIPSRYWLLVKEILKVVTERLDSYVVFVTATEPLIFDRHEVFDLVEPYYYFNKLDRVVLETRLERDLSPEEFLGTIVLEEDKSYLFILNTIKAASIFYKLVRNSVGEEVIFLSTHVTSFERLRRIKDIKDGKTRIAVSTQLVEAGVDIDFDVVFRDIAPLDSVNQAAGRCNRNWNEEGEKGKIVVVSLKDDKRLFADYVYDDVLLEITRDILGEKKTIPENEFLNIIDSYYKKLQDKKSSDASFELIEAAYKMKYDSVDETVCIGDFKLIPDDYPKVDVFIEINSEAEEIWQKYLHIKETENLFERRLAFDEIKADFYKFIVSIPIAVKNLPPLVAGFRYVNRHSLDEYYDAVTGFKTEGVLSIW